MNDLWKTKEEIPEFGEFVYIVVEMNQPTLPSKWLVSDEFYTEEWTSSYMDRYIVRWCYLSDLIEASKGETT